MYLKKCGLQYIMDDNIKYSIFNSKDKLSERKEELLQQRKEIKKIVKEIYKEKTSEMKRQMRIVKTKNQKVKNPEAVSAQKNEDIIGLKRVQNLETY